MQPQPATVTATAPRPATAQLEGERRPATVILADVTGSTDLLEQIGTEAWVEIMNHIFQILGSEIYRFGGEVDQFRGDGLLAFFGATSTHEDDPERAVLAALAMQTAIHPYAAELAEGEDIDLRLRVGVNTGQVIAATVGDSHQHSEETAMGEAITLAARMEESAEPGTVLVSENTYRLVQSRFEWQPLGEITVRGISHPVAVYRPLTHRADVERPQRLQLYGLSIPLIGREEEFRTIKRHVEGLYDGRGGIVMVTGEKGLGKSFLVSEVRQHSARQSALLAEAHSEDASPPPPLTWLRGRCRSYDQAWPYSMWRDLVRSWLGVKEDEPQIETRNRLRQQAEALWGDRLAEHYPYLATFLSLPPEETFADRVKHLDADGLRHQFFFTLRSWVEALAQRGPLVLAFADVHWADTTSLELLKYCLPLCDHQAILWIIVFRPERTSSVWGVRHHVETEYPHRAITLTLPPLNEAQSSEFIDRLIGREILPPETRTLVLDKAEGNPYYIEELIRSLIEQGTLVQDAQTGKWHTTRAVTSLDLPDSLQSLLLARIDCCLSPEERNILQMAAVIGSVFWLNVLQALARDVAALEAPLLKRHLTTLQRSQLIDERGRAPDLGMEYAFKSNLIRDAAYESLLSAQRASYHLRVAEYLEDLFGTESVALYYGVMAYHYRQAGRHRKELFYSLQAAEHAQNIYANVEALEHYARALELLDEMEAQATDENQLYAIHTQRFEVLNGRRGVLFLMGDFDAMWADAQALLPLAQELEDDPSWMIDALLQQPGVASWQTKEELDAGSPMAQQALTLAQQLGDPRREMQSLVALARQRLWADDPSGWQLADRALEMARQLGDQRYEVGILTGLGHAYATREPERSMKYLEAALPLSQALDDKTAELEILNLIGVHLERDNDYCRRLTECHEKQLRLSREIGHRPAEGRALMFCGQIQGLYLGDYETGLSLLEESLRLWEGIPAELYPLLRLVQTHTVQGRYDVALATLERARRVGEHHTEQMALVGLDLVSTILYNNLADSQTPDAQAHLQMALDLTSQNRQVFVDNPQLSRQYQMVAACEATVAHLGLAEMAANKTERQNHLRLALESSQAALDIYQSFGFVQPIECVSEEILYRHSLALAANGLETAAIDYLKHAYDEMMDKHDLIPPDSPFRRTYLENIPLHRKIHAAMLPFL
jgi:class 3 adenylate cyclase